MLGSPCSGREEEKVEGKQGHSWASLARLQEGEGEAEWRHAAGQLRIGIGRRERERLGRRRSCGPRGREEKGGMGLNLNFKS